MAKSKIQKNSELQDLQSNLSAAKSLVFTSFSKLTVAEVNELRAKLRGEKIAYQAAKKTLLKKALNNAEVASEIDKLTGNVAIAFGLADEISPAKVLVNFSKEHKALEVGFGLFSGSIVPREKVGFLANLPAKEQLVAQMIGTISAPLGNLIGFGHSTLRSLVGTLTAISAKKS